MEVYNKKGYGSGQVLLSHRRRKVMLMNMGANRMWHSAHDQRKKMVLGDL